MNPAILLFILFVVALFLHLPIGYALGFSAIVTLLSLGLYDPSFIIQTYYSAASSFTLLAIPFFILAGDIMLYGGISDKLVGLGRALFGHSKGALGIITVFSCMIFAALSGSGPATTAAIGGILIPAMVEEGYDEGFAATLTATSGALGPIIPPSIPFVMYGITCQVSIADMFAAGMIPGVMMGLILMVYCKLACKKYHFGVPAPKKTGREKLLALKDAFWAILAPVIILGGIYGGIFTPTEAAIIACVYSLFVGAFVYKKIKIKDLFVIVSRSALTTGTCLILLGGATLFGRILSGERVPTMLASALLSISDNKVVILLLITLMLFITGMFMETIAAILILSPLLLSVVKQFDVTPLHFGVILCTNLVVGLCTPPVGVNLFVASRKAGIGLEKMFRWLVPAVGCLMAVVLLITFCPAIVEIGPNFVHWLQSK